MTRKEQIKEYLRVIGSGDMENIPFDVGFECGVEWADSHPRWISVEDELPTCNVFVLTCDGQGNTNLLMLAGNGGWYDHSVAKHRNITHWMPLPSPPSESVTTCNHTTSSCSEIPTNCQSVTPRNQSKGGEE